MTAQPRKLRVLGPRPTDSPRRTSGPPPGDDSAAGTARYPGPDLHSGRLACSVDAAARLTGLSRDLQYDHRRHVNVGTRHLMTRQHRQQFPGTAS
jgi:hypothetical protein